MNELMSRLVVFLGLTLLWGVCVSFLAHSHGAAGWWVATVVALVCALIALVRFVEHRRQQH